MVDLSRFVGLSKVMIGEVIYVSVDQVILMYYLGQDDLVGCEVMVVSEVGVVQARLGLSSRDESLGLIYLNQVRKLYNKCKYFLLN